MGGGEGGGDVVCWCRPTAIKDMTAGSLDPINCTMSSVKAALVVGRLLTVPESLKPKLQANSLTQG